MPSNNTIQRTINLTSTFLQNRIISGVGSFVNEPALSIGDWVRGFILSPPFAWRWNRNTTAITVSQGTQDYQKNLADFGWLEISTLSDGSGNFFQLMPVLNLGEEATQNTPLRIAARLDDDNGNITFRLMPVPEKSYTLNISYQKAPPVFSALTDTWAPIPDYLSVLYNQGFLAKSYEFASDERALPATQLFMRMVIAANSGLSDSQVNIFLADTIINSQRQLQAELGNSQAGRAGRGAF